MIVTALVCASFFAPDHLAAGLQVKLGLQRFDQIVFRAHHVAHLGDLASLHQDVARVTTTTTVSRGFFSAVDSGSFTALLLGRISTSPSSTAGEDQDREDVYQRHQVQSTSDTLRVCVRRAFQAESGS